MNLAVKLSVAVRPLLFLLVSACTATSNQIPKVTAGSLTTPTESEVIEDIWRLNERIILELALWVEGDFESDFSLQDFAGAIEFFEDRTGILSHTGSYFGWVPTIRTRSTMAKWNAWFEENKDTFVLTPSSCLSKAPVVDDAEESQEAEQQ